MSSSTGINQPLSNVVKLHWFLLWIAVLLACCCCISAKAVDVDAFLESEMIDNDYPNAFFQSESDFAERAIPRLGRALPRLGRALPRLGRALPRLGRAMPRLGRALPRLGRATPRLGRYISDGMYPRINHAGRYYGLYDDMLNDDAFNGEYLFGERQTASQMGRAT